MLILFGVFTFKSELVDKSVQLIVMQKSHFPLNTYLNHFCAMMHTFYYTLSFQFFRNSGLALAYQHLPVHSFYYVYIQRGTKMLSNLHASQKATYI